MLVFKCHSCVVFLVFSGFLPPAKSREMSNVFPVLRCFVRHAVAVLTITSLTFHATFSFGNDAQKTFAGLSDRSALPLASEFYLSHVEGEILIPINVIGAVNRPGLYYAPKNTDIYRILAAVGGFRPDADLSRVVIKRRAADLESVIEIDLEDYLRQPQSDRIILVAEDVLHVEAIEPIVSQNSISLMSIAASILSILLTATVIHKNM